MKSKVLDNIVEWKKLSNKIAEQFLYDYFDDLDPDYSWVCDEEGNLLTNGDNPEYNIDMFVIEI